MLRSVHLNKELRKNEKIIKKISKLIEQSPNKYSEEAQLLLACSKSLDLLCKLLRDVKTNQVIIMEAQGIELIKETDKSEKNKLDKKEETAQPITEEQKPKDDV
ncbi:MAG: hypothetical protein ACTSPD_10245 [Promethearchaeota archaeon]